MMLLNTFLNYSTTDCFRSNANCREAVQRLEQCHFPKGATMLERNYGVPWPYYFEVRFGTDTEIVVEIGIDAGFALLTLNMTLILTLINIKVIEILKNVSKSEMTLSGVNLFDAWNCFFRLPDFADLPGLPPLELKNGGTIAPACMSILGSKLRDSEESMVTFGGNLTWVSLLLGKLRVHDVQHVQWVIMWICCNSVMWVE